MMVRKGNYQDAPFIKLLMEGLGYKTSNSLLVVQLQSLFAGPSHEVWVCEDKGEITGFTVFHILPQLAFDGSLLVISYLYIDERVKEQVAARVLEAHIYKVARQRQCERIQVHCAPWRAAAEQFFLAQGYVAYPQYYTKRLMYGE